MAGQVPLDRRLVRRVQLGALGVERDVRLDRSDRLEGLGGRHDATSSRGDSSTAISPTEGGSRRSQPRHPSAEATRLCDVQDDDHGGLERRGRRCRDAEEHHRLVERGDQHRADRRAGEREPPAGERGATDHDGEDRVEFELVPGLRHVDGHHRAGREDAGDPGEERAQRVHGDQQGTAVQAGEPAGLGVDPDRLDHHPERRTTDHQRHQHDDRHR